MDELQKYNRMYIERFALELLKVVANDRGDKFIDDFVAKVFEFQSLQKAFLDAYNTLPPADLDAAGRAAITALVEKARRNPEPII